MNYHNTTKLRGKQLTQAQKEASKQDVRLLKILRRYKTPKSASYLHWRYLVEFCGLKMSHAEYVDIKPNKVPLTSIRRSLNTLMNSGYIEIVEVEGEPLRTPGIYGKSEFNYLALV